ncbi:helix-turn-helix domain-containing protein [Streptomyces sp. NA04227]|uniref:helix-turn-helix domain-containing protein n=1 Tax=Streptomyces sp. NA04227 TaxID=2742136 RepID=UPI0015907CC6|nr:helix-turn-helix domain-containing protein [Streptomyces sp. NA04227]QKW07378.1 helix-turn-helix domain-containing protein [Streptomyces sp. NA04227]
MSSHSSHSVTAATLPQLFRPAEVAEALGCSEWWVKEQARQRRIPFTRAGGAYRFTAEHYAEIVLVFEELPLRDQRTPTDQTRSRVRVTHTMPTNSASASLRAKKPRRVVRTQSALAA